MGAALQKYNQEIANETEAGGADAAGGGMNNASSIPQVTHHGVAPVVPPPPQVVMPTIAPTPGLRGLAPEQADIQDSFSTTNQYQQRYGIAQQHF